MNLDTTVWHEGAHVASARCFGFSARVELGLCPDLDGGDLARTYLEGDGDRSPLARAIISYAPVYVIAFSDWQSHAFSGDREVVERVRPSHWPAAVWEFHVAEKTREFVQTDRFRLAYHEACIELEEQESARWGRRYNGP